MSVHESGALDLVAAVSVVTTKGARGVGGVGEAADWIHEHQPSHASVEIALEDGTSISIDVDDECDVDTREDARRRLRRRIAREILEVVGG